MAVITIRKSAALTLICLSVLTGCASSRTPVPVGTIPKPKPISLNDEQYGHQVLESLSQRFELDFDHPRYDEVLDIVDKLTAGVGADNDPWHVHVFKDDSFRNAAATRGNHIFIWTAMIDATKNEGELASVLSHELAHVLAGHTEPDPQEELNRVLIGLGAAAAGIAVSAVINNPVTANNLGNLAASLTQEVGEGIVTNPYSRELELEADHVGLMIMAKAGYDPREAVNFWKRASADPDFSTHAEFFSTHPLAKARLERLEKLLPKALKVYRDPSSLPVGTQNKVQPETTPSGLEKWRTAFPDVPVYEGPSLGSTIITRLDEGTELKVIRTRRGWLTIESPVSGYIKGSLAEPS